MSELNRRNFLKGAVAATASLAAAAALGGCSQTASSAAAGSAAASSTAASEAAQTTAEGPYLQYDICGKLSMSEFEASAAVAEPIEKFDAEENYDVVVIGAGASGMPAAIAAYEGGASVCVLQKESTATSQGSVSFILDAERTNEAGKIGLLYDLRKWCNYRSNSELNLAWANNCSEAMDWFVKKLTESGMVEGQDFNIFSEGEYHYEGGGEAYGKLCMCTGSYTAAINSLGEYFKEKFTIYFKTPAVQLIKENDKVVGVYAKKEDGTILKVTANKGVVLATGDYQNNDAMVLKYLPDAAIFDKKQFGRTGDGHLMGLMAGAKMQNIGHTKMIHTKNWGGCCTLMKSLPFMAVNKNGVRFTSEDIPYDLRNNFVKNQPGLCWLSIFDANYQEQYAAMGYSGRDISTPDQIAESDGAFVADTLEDLAEQMGIDAAALVATVERYNEMCEQGFDLEFGKPAKYMAPIKQAPFYGLHYEYAVSAITSGLEVDKDARVLDENGQPIEGFYAVGNCSGPFYGSVDYPLDIPGLSISRAITLGYVVGKTLAQQ